MLYDFLLQNIFKFQKYSIKKSQFFTQQNAFKYWNRNLFNQHPCFDANGTTHESRVFRPILCSLDAVHINISEHRQLCVWVVCRLYLCVRVLRCGTRAFNATHGIHSEIIQPIVQLVASCCNTRVRSKMLLVVVLSS